MNRARIVAFERADQDDPMLAVDELDEFLPTLSDTEDPTLTVNTLYKLFGDKPFVGSVETDRFALYPVTRPWSEAGSTPLVSGIVRVASDGCTVEAEASVPLFPPPIAFPLTARLAMRRLAQVVDGIAPERLTPRSALPVLIRLAITVIAALVVVTIVLGR